MSGSVPPATESVGQPWVRWGQERWGWTLWATFTLIIGVIGYLDWSERSVVQVYYDGAVRFLRGEPLYDHSGTGYVYLPQLAAIFAPFTLLPLHEAGVLWRVLNVAAFAIGVWRFTRCVGQEGAKNLFSLVSVLVIPLTWSSARHGQMTLAMGAMMLLAVADLIERRWWRAVFWLAVGLAVKQLVIVLMLLAVVLYPRTWWRVAVAAVALMGLPLLMQRPEYLWDQHLECVRMFDDMSRFALTYPRGFAHLFTMLNAIHVEIPPAAQTALRLVAAVLTLAVCWLAKRRLSPSRFGMLLFTLATAYLLLFSPRTERNTYCLLAPALGLFATEAILAGRRTQAAVVIGLVLASLASHPLATLLVGGPTLWIKPLLCLVFVAMALGQFWSELGRRRGAESPRAARSLGLVSREIPPPSLQRLLVVRNDRLGDVVLTLPAIAVLRRSFPHAHITGLLSPYTAPLFEYDRTFDDLIVDEPGTSAWALGQRLRAGRFDAALVIYPNTRNCLAAWFARIPQRVCWANKPIGCLLGNRRVWVRRSHPPIHESRYALAFAERLGCQIPRQDVAVRVEIDPARQQRIAERIARELGVQDPLFGVHPGSFGSSYNWPPERYAELIARLAGHGRVLVTGGATEAVLLEQLRGSVPVSLRRRVGFFGDLSLPELAAAVRMLDVLIVSSTGPMHLAGILGTPAVALFSAHPLHSPEKWRPLGTGHTILVAPLEAGADLEIPRERGAQHMAGIAVEHVLEAAAGAIQVRLRTAA